MKKQSNSTDQSQHDDIADSKPLTTLRQTFSKTIVVPLLTLVLLGGTVYFAIYQDFDGFIHLKLRIDGGELIINKCKVSAK
jgi:hypothetical protein